MKFEKKPMVNWYGVRLLVSTGLKTIISQMFGNFADKREIQAALSPHDGPYDYSDKGELWLDYVADLGDGFNSTFTMAHLMAQDSLKVGEDDLKRGDVLVMGGDEVYPTPETEEYKNRLQGPYNAAFPWQDGDANRPRLFAIPGNHDWYDGLTNFIRLFCQGRSLGNWHTAQHRSYFALKLPHNVWLLGIDIQLNGDIDSPQLKYFKGIASKDIQSGDTIILSTAEPSWVYKSWDDGNTANDRLNHFIHHILLGKGEDYEEKNEKVKLAAVLTGDLHHYSRYEGDVYQQGQACQLITAGGGGAFTHPTHALKEQIKPDLKRPVNLKTIFPSKNQSKKLAYWNLIFPYYSLGMMTFLGAFFLITSWFLQSTHHELSFMEKAAKMPFSWSQFVPYLELILDRIRHSPAVMVLNAVLFLGIFFFTDTKLGKRKLSYLVGFIHSIMQISCFYIGVWLFSILNLSVIGWDLVYPWQVALFSLEMVFIGGFISAFVFGIYLLISSLVVKNHPTESFSSFRWDGYKNFLRIHIGPKGIKIYPIGVKKVVTDWKDIGQERPSFEGSKVDFELIEKIDPIITT